MGLAFSSLSFPFSRAPNNQKGSENHLQTKCESEKEDEAEEMKLRSGKMTFTPTLREKRSKEVVTARGEPELQVRTRKKQRMVVCSKSPKSALNRHFEFSWYDVDIWTEVAKYLSGNDLIMLSIANRWFNSLIMEEYIWKFACLRDLQVPSPLIVSFSWMQIYLSAFDGSHSYCFRQQEKHIDWMRIGAFYFDSSIALLSENLCMPKRLPRTEDDPARCIRTSGTCLLSNIRTGIWIADMHLVRCPVCNINTCEGTMQMLDVRHAELFLEDDYKNGNWDYTDIGTCRIDKSSASAASIIFDVKYLDSPCTKDLLDNKKSWIGKETEFQPKAKLCLHAVAVNTNLQPNDGLNVKFQAMRSNRGNRDVVSIRISQQLI